MADVVVDLRKARTYERSANDWYIEPRWAVELFLQHERFNGLIYDPACGSGTIPQAAADHGYQAVGSDLIPRMSADQPAWNFLERGPAIQAPANIVSNPPYKLAEDFLRISLKAARMKVAFLLRLTFLESEGRHEMFNTTPLARIYVHSDRVSMPPGGTAVEAEGGKVCYAWFVWSHDQPRVGGSYQPPVIRWLKRPAADKRRRRAP